MITLTEQGMYFFLNRSDKPAALPMQKWVAGEVLPAIRKTGKYEVKGTGKTPVPSNTAIPHTKEFRALFGVARLIGLDKNAAAISANQAVIQITGVNMLSMLGQTHLDAEKQDLVFNVSDLSDGISGVKMNRMLEAAGMQTKADERWIPTEKGKKFSRVFDTGKRHSNGTPVQQLKWYRDVLSELKVSDAA